MIALKILDLRKFMSAFLIRDLFNEYSLIEAQVRTFCTYSIDGRLERAFFETEHAAGTVSPDTSVAKASAAQDAPGSVEYVRWNMVKPHVYNLIRGKRTPLSFKFVFFYPPEKLASFLTTAGLRSDAGDVYGLCVNLRYDGAGLVLTTGISRKGFTLDRSVDEVWDAAVRGLLTGQDIGFEAV